MPTILLFKCRMCGKRIEYVSMQETTPRSDPLEQAIMSNPIAIVNHECKEGCEGVCDLQGSKTAEPEPILGPSMGPSSGPSPKPDSGPGLEPMPEELKNVPEPMENPPLVNQADLDAIPDTMAENAVPPRPVRRKPSIE